VCATYTRTGWPWSGCQTVAASSASTTSNATGGSRASRVPYPGHLSRQRPPALRWALFETPQVARRPGSPDRGYYDQAAARLGGNRACLALARKLLKRSFHTLRELGDDALLAA
jgi:hypothetical protein